MTHLHPTPAATPVAELVGTTAAALPTARYAIRDTATVMPGIVAFGLMLGVTITTLGADRLAGLAGTFLVYGGSAQLTAITLLDHGIAIPAAILTAAIVNLRLLLYSAALAERFRPQPRVFRMLAPHLIIDQTYLMAAARPTLVGAHFRRYWCWLGASVLVVWSGSVTSGMLLGPVIPDLPHLGLVATALFIGMLVPRLTSRPAVVAALVGGPVAAGVSLLLPALGIISGAIAGVAAALAVSRHD